jgi:NhaP-type Na+/H+ or K+/H+ antiporter
VIAILHETKASEELAGVIEGESLLNDGVSFVFFEIFDVRRPGSPM